MWISKPPRAPLLIGVGKEVYAADFWEVFGGSLMRDLASGPEVAWALGWFSIDFFF